MSPAFSDNPDDIFTWVGVIMYVKDRRLITPLNTVYTPLKPH